VLVTLTLQLQDGSANLGTVNYTFTLGCNTACAGAPRISTSTIMQVLPQKSDAILSIVRRNIGQHDYVHKFDPGI